jgi:hypothetical protein
MAHETPDDLQALQALLDTSLAQAGPHLASIFGETPPVPAAELVALLDGMQVLDLATVTASGEPRVAPVDGHLYRGRWLFGTATNAARARHLAARPAVSAAHTRGEGPCVITHGYAEAVDLREPAAAPVLAHLRAAYPTFDEWGSLDNPYWTIRPTRMYVRWPREVAG